MTAHPEDTIRHAWRCSFTGSPPLLMIFMIFFGEELMETGEEGEEAAEALAGTFLPSLHVSIGADDPGAHACCASSGASANPRAALPATMKR